MVLSAEPAPTDAPSLHNRLASARTALAAGDDRAVAQLEADLVVELGENTEPEKAALIGSVRTLAELARFRRTGIERPREWARAVEAFVRAGDGPSQRRDHVADLGCALLLSGDADRAEPMLRRALALGVATADSWRCFGLALNAQGEHRRARQVLENASRLFPADWQIAEALARIVQRRSRDRAAAAAAWARAGAALADAGLAKRAVAAYTAALNNASSHGGLLLALCRAHFAAAQLDDMLKVLRRVARMDSRLAPELVPTMVDLAGALLDQPEEDDFDRLSLATELAREGTTREPDHAQARALLGEAHRRWGELTEAEGALSLALALDPTNAYAWGKRGLTRIESELWDDAVVDLDRAAQLAPSIVWIRLGAGEAYYMRAEKSAGPEMIADARHALEHLDEVVRREPDNARGWRLQAYAHWLMAHADPGELAESARALRRGLELEPDEPGIMHELSKVLYRLGEHAKALDLVEGAARVLVDDPYVLLTRGQIRTAVGDVAAALPDLENAVRGAPELAEAHAGLGEAYRRLSRFEDALAEFDIALRDEPDDFWLLGNRGATLMALRRVGPAMDDLRRSLELEPSDSWTLSWLCDGLRQTATTEAMVQEIAGHARRAPDDQDVQEVYADVLSSASRHEEAIEVAERSLSTKPDHAGLLRTLGWAHFAMERESQALDYMRRAVAVSATAATMADLAWLQSRCNRVTEALATVERGLADGPDGNLLRLRSDILAEIADWPGSAAAAHEAIAVGPPDVGAYRALGWALEHTGASRAEALSAYREARRLDDTDVTSQRGIADTLWILGKLDQARAEYEALLERLRELVRNDPAQDYDIGWSLCRLGRHQEAGDALLRALTVIPDRAMVLFDIGLNWLAAGEPVRAADAYTKGFEVVGVRHLARSRGMLAVGAWDLRDAVVGKLVSETDYVRDLIARLDTAAAAYPVEPPADVAAFTGEYGTVQRDRDVGS